MPTPSPITIRGAREHNLKNVTLTLPRNRLICFTGVSGSGKSSLAFDTLYAEGQRRYIESLSSYARQFLDRMQKPLVESISGLAPAISISQKTGGQNIRSTVGTITEIYDFLRLLYARVSTGFCPQCGRPVVAQTRGQIFDRLNLFPFGSQITILAPQIRAQRGEHRDLFRTLKKRGLLRARVDGQTVLLEEELALDRTARHTIEAVIDRIELAPDQRNRISEAIESGLKQGEGKIIALVESKEETTPPVELFFSSEYACPECGLNFESPEPRLFSFNSPQGMCPECEGIGEIFTFSEKLLVPTPESSLREGCIVPLGSWDQSPETRRRRLRTLLKKAAGGAAVCIDALIDTPWKDLDPKYKKALLYGFNPDTSTSGFAPTQREPAAGQIRGVIDELHYHYARSSQRQKHDFFEPFMMNVPCHCCHGGRLNEQARSYRLETDSDAPPFAQKKSFNISELAQLPISDLIPFIERIKLTDTQKMIAHQAIKEISARLSFLSGVGLDYLSLARTAPTLSGGEMQRIRLAGQIGSALSGVLYVLDEPSIGLHSRDNKRLIQTLHHLRDLGNTVVVVEHDEETMRSADWLVDFGPGPGQLGGEVVAEGTPQEIMKEDRSITARYLTGKEAIPIPTQRKPLGKKKLIVRGATHNNLKNIDVEIPLGGIVCITGVSGSGKSSLVNDILLEALNRDLNHGKGNPGAYRSIEGIEYLDKLIAIDQSPIGRTPRSNPVTYTKLFDDIRRLFSELPEAKARGFTPGRFSFNLDGGRCQSCQGSGVQQLEMDFLADVWITCPTCGGHRFNNETRSILYKGMPIDRILDLEVNEALEVFKNHPKIAHKLQTLKDVGLGYMKLGQSSPTLSGGEAQRIKLARELVKHSTGKTLYLLDEPTTGLHFSDIKQLLFVLRNFADQGNTVLVVEHNLDVVKTADWVIDLGPEGGAGGGEIIAIGTPEDIMRNPRSFTGKSLAEHLKMSGHADWMVSSNARKTSPESQLTAEWRSDAQKASDNIIVEGARQHNLQNISVDIPRFKTTVCCGMSGSGKSSLAMDTVYAEGQRRYVESLSSYARQFLGQMPKADVDRVTGISPAIAIEQKGANRSPRSTVGTATEIQDYLRVLYARLGDAYCPDCDIPIGTQSSDEIAIKLLEILKTDPILLTAPVAVETIPDFGKYWVKLRGDGFIRVRIDSKVYRIEEVPVLDKKRVHRIEIVIDRIRPGDFEDEKKLLSRVAGSTEHALSVGGGEIIAVIVDKKIPEEDWEEIRLSQHRTCPNCGRSFERLTQHHFSFNSPRGWCPHCEGLGVETGLNPLHYLRDPKKTLLDGALQFFPAKNHPLSLAMLERFCQVNHIPTDIPFEQLDSRTRRLIFQGTGDKKYTIQVDFSSTWPAPVSDENSSPNTAQIVFQFKGIFSALDEAQRLVPSLRYQLDYAPEEIECTVCMGSRLNDEAAAVRFHNLPLDRLGRMPINELFDFFNRLQLTEQEEKIAGEIIYTIKSRLQFLLDVGLDYLTLSRSSASLSGGESQRIRLAGQIGSGLTGVLYVLDEPTIGLHPRDNSRLIGAIQKLRDLGNTVLMVEHDRQVIESADYLLDFGPKAGRLGGQVVASGSPIEVTQESNSVTGPYLSGTKTIPIPKNRRIVY